ncbi:Sec-independent protein translocase protein TatB [Candidatus Parabeggiatoa sp. HSG14]|uniref:Sec-independent protein translocase protein TatB n=1 Tax=Candidatus Parabeggiatoa sp. HSG14 TaxID=3055593 RepID=UPI0025A69976|nr:Sec-independent protein translocase protein TatB [Thiotrichales bacterium HSG14]
MFDIGFWELCLILVVALLVFGPEKLPGAARTAGLWAGRIRRMVTNFKQDIDRELHLQEIQDSIKQNDGLHEFIEETKTGLSELNKPFLSDYKQITEDKPDSPNKSDSPDSTSDASHIPPKTNL